MVDAHCIQAEGVFSVHWLLRFVGLGLALRYIQFEEYVDHVN